MFSVRDSTSLSRLGWVVRDLHAAYAQGCSGLLFILARAKALNLPPLIALLPFHMHDFRRGVLEKRTSVAHARYCVRRVIDRAPAKHRTPSAVHCRYLLKPRCVKLSPSAVVVCNELRSHSVQGRFLELFSATHTIKTVPHSKLDETYQHQNIFVYIMHKKKDKKAKGKDKDKEQGGEEAGEGDAEEGQGRAGGAEGAGGEGEGEGAAEGMNDGLVGEGRGGAEEGRGRGGEEGEEGRAG